MFIAMSRKSMINVRLAQQTHEEFKIVCELRGASMSTLLHQFIVKAIREEKELSPRAFQTGDKVLTISETNNAVIVGTPVFPELAEVKPKKKRAG